MLLSYILHFANRHRSYNDDVQKEFYQVKDKILSRYGTIKPFNYDIQHIPGKTCNSCGGKGYHNKYGHDGEIYDYADCYHCWGGWYKLPKWICLQRIHFGTFTFHKPLKRRQCVDNPFSKEELGWEVTPRPIIEGYIEHQEHWLSEVSFLFLLWWYNMPSAKKQIEQYLFWKRVRISNRWHNFWRLQTFIFWKPTFLPPKWMHAKDGQLHYDEELPF